MEFAQNLTEIHKNLQCALVKQTLSKVFVNLVFNDFINKQELIAHFQFVLHF
jgi:hypothetical protein